MSLDNADEKLAAAFDGPLARAVRVFTGSRTVPGEFDPVTGTTADTTETYEGRGVFGSFRQDEIDGQHIIGTDTKLTALQNEVTGEPKVNDEIDGKAVKAVMQDPAGVAWTLALRRT